MTINYISKDKAALHLKLGRKLAMFIKTDHFFEDATFDWISIEKTGDEYQSTLIRSINQGDQLFNDVLSFDTLNQRETGLDAVSNNFFTGTLSACFEWIQITYDVGELKFIPPENLKIIYTDLVTKGAFAK